MKTRSPWALALAMSLGAMAGIGLARFAYALLLPAMRADLGWTYSQAGALGAANAFGYLAGAVLTLRLVHAWGNRRIFVIGLVLTTLALLAAGSTRDHTMQSIWRALAGLGAAGTFICGGVLAGTLSLTMRGEARPGLGVTVFFAGGGLGILVSGVALPLWLAAAGDSAWPGLWTAMGVLALVATLLGFDAIRFIDEPGRGGQSADWPWRNYVVILLAYLLFGLGYIAYMTFIVAWMRQHGAAPTEVATVWALLGSATIAGPAVWGRRFRRSRGGRSMAEALTAFGIGALLPLLSTHVAALLASAVLVGGSVFMIPSSVTLLIRHELPQAAWGRALSVLTILFALGQVVGPLLTGWLADFTGSLFAGLIASAALLFAGAVAAWTQFPRTA